MIPSVAHFPWKPAAAFGGLAPHPTRFGRFRVGLDGRLGSAAARPRTAATASDDHYSGSVILDGPQTGRSSAHMSTSVSSDRALQDDTPESLAPGHSLTRVVLAWCVHLFTASGAVIAAAALIAIGRGDLATAGWLMLVALIIDAIDGSFARLVGVRQVLPHMDGRRLDDMVDYLNFVIVPAVFMVAAGSLLWWGLAALPILASAYGFSQEDAKTEDDFFLGWPSYWNVLALYLWLLDLSPLAGSIWLVGLSIAVFVPLKYIYPSKLKVLRITANLGGLIWSLVLIGAIAMPELAERFYVVEITLSYPIFYMVLSVVLGGWLRKGAFQH
jgi:phosphatidylcholine synthase